MKEICMSWRSLIKESIYKLFFARVFRFEASGKVGIASCFHWQIVLWRALSTFGRKDCFASFSPLTRLSTSYLTIKTINKPSVLDYVFAYEPMKRKILLNQNSKFILLSVILVCIDSALVALVWIWMFLWSFNKLIIVVIMIVAIVFSCRFFCCKN